VKIVTVHTNTCELKWPWCYSIALIEYLFMCFYRYRLSDSDSDVTCIEERSPIRLVVINYYACLLSHRPRILGGNGDGGGHFCQVFLKQGLLGVATAPNLVI